MTPVKTFTTPSGGKYTRNVGGKKTAKRGKTVTKQAKGGGVMHKAYTYTNKKGKRVTVASHVEHPYRGGGKKK